MEVTVAAGSAPESAQPASCGQWYETGDCGGMGADVIADFQGSRGWGRGGQAALVFEVDVEEEDDVEALPLPVAAGFVSDLVSDFDSALDSDFVSDVDSGLDSVDDAEPRESVR
jgi:hypothetical protein